MQVNILNHNNSLVNEYLYELRSIEVQYDSMRFRRNLERLGEIFAYEISKSLDWENKITKTPLGNSEVRVLKNQPVIATILRAGLPLHQGLLNYFDKAENAFISAFRKHTDDGSFDIQIEYLSSPLIDGKKVILSDPMLATGSSMLLGYQALLQKGKPEHVHIVAIVASKEGVEYIEQNMPENTTLWIGAVDKDLNSKAYIVPGLGDAGDLAFGEKE